MMAVQSRVAVEEFDRVAGLPENADRRLEFIGGEVVEVVTNNYASIVAMRVAAALTVHVQKGKLGYVTGADGGYQVSGERYIPDAAFISRAKQSSPSHETYNSKAPDLAVEVVSPTDLPKDITDKVVGYLAAGTVVWVVYPDRQQAKVYQPGQPPRTIDIDGALDGGDVLPDFKLPLRDVFVEQD
jgi:Uma2 family endonuclease